MQFEVHHASYGYRHDLPRYAVHMETNLADLLN